jgi:elongation factor Ts
MAISASDVKKLREMTGVGPLECKKALEQFDGDFAAAEKYLKEKGLAAVEKRADRATSEGRIFVKKEGNDVALAEISSETDFVARNPDFIALGNNIVALVLEKGYTETNSELSALVSDLAVKIGENMSLKRIKLVKAADNEFVTQYMHGEGAIGVVVKLSSPKADAVHTAEAKEFAHNLALHIAAFNPLALEKSKLDPAFVKEQKDIFRGQMDNDENMKSKPEAAREKILEGKINKYLSEICLMDQSYVKDDKLTVAQAVAECGKKLGADISINDYVYFKVGQ